MAKVELRRCARTALLEMEAHHRRRAGTAPLARGLHPQPAESAARPRGGGEEEAAAGTAEGAGGAVHPGADHEPPRPFRRPTGTGRMEVDGRTLAAPDLAVRGAD